MIWYSAFFLVISVITALPSQKLHPLSDEFIEQINRKQSTWKAGRNFEVEEFELFKVMASGAKRNNHPGISIKIHDENAPINESFDARETWPQCADIIGLIRDQSRCGSSWALSAAAGISDRICILSMGTRKMLISAQDILTCSDYGGCNGGFDLDAWYEWQWYGIVTGGLYKRTDQGCKSYFLPPCDDHPNKCTDYVDTPQCVKACDNSSIDYTSQKTYGQKAYLLRGEKQIQLDVLNHGPLGICIGVYEDFASYKSGIYQYTTGESVGTLSAKLIGWGEENGTKYWTIANSWNERWGENGYFRIIRGKNEVGIEDCAVAAVPDFSRF